MNFHLIGLFLFALPLLCSGQWHAFTKYGPEQGMTDSSVTSLALDSGGFLWIGTERGGLLRYDGQDFISFSRRRTGIPRSIRAVTTNSGLLFVGTDTGVRCLRLRANGVDSADARFNRAFAGLRDRVLEQKMDRRGRFHVRTIKGYWTCDLANAVVRPSIDTHVFERERQYEQIPAAVRAVARDARGRYWYATNAGLFCEDGSALRRFHRANGLPDNDARTIVCDREGGIWYGAASGLYHFIPDRVRIYAGGAGLPLAAGMIRRAACGSDGSIWLATSTGVWRVRAGTAQLFTRGRPPANAHHVLPRGPDQFLYGTTTGLTLHDLDRAVTLTRDSGLPSDTITALLESSHGGFWIGTPRGLMRWRNDSMRILTVRDGLPDDFIAHIAEDDNGDVWVATNNGACLISRAANEDVIHLKEFSGLDIQSVYVDRQGAPWFGTANDGVFALKGEGIIHITEREGLARGGVRSIIQDDFGTLYFGTPSGLVALPEANIRYYAPKDTFQFWHNRSMSAMLPLLRATGLFRIDGAQGFPSPVLLHTAAADGGDGTLFFATAAGLVQYSPRDPAARDSISPELIVHRIQIGERDVPVADSVTLDSDERVLRVHVLLPTFRNPGQRRFLYRLEDFEYIWHECNDGQLLISGLTPGSYRLAIRAGIGEGIWTEERWIYVHVREPFTESALFYSLMLIAALVVGYFFRVAIGQLRDRSGRISPR